jgi:mannose PTS system EIID component
VTGSLSRGSIVSSFFRSFLIQGSWNYHTMLGGGFAFAMLPGLRRLFGADDGALDESVQRHLEHFNAHPYLSTVALGAALSLERDGADADTVRRFKAAVRGPLGSLGDGLVWAAWLPGVSVLALTLYWLGAPGWLAAAIFLVLYNLGHVGLRVWGFRAGLSEGRQVGKRLVGANLSWWTGRMKAVTVLLLGLLVGALAGGGGALAGAGTLWLALAACAFVIGLLGGHRAWRPAAATVVVAIVVLSAWGHL